MTASATLKGMDMLKVICIVDKEGTALDRLAKGVAKYHDNIEYKVVAVHPKRPDAYQLANFERLAKDADVIDAQYYRTLYKLREIFPWLKDKKTILTHNNPYAIEEQEWNDVEINVGNNFGIEKRLGEITQTTVEYVPLCVDTDFWQFNPDWKFIGKTDHAGKYHWNTEAQKPKVLMVANRIESKKGILEVAQACKELNLHFILVGAISDATYFSEVLRTGIIEFHEKISDEKLKEIYYKSTIHVCNSADNFESGTMPILEAMLCGVPVLTRNVGHVPDLNNGENMVVREGAKEDIEDIKSHLSEMINDKSRLQTIRDKAWQSAKSRSFERRAYMYQKLYRQAQYPDQAPVSIVVPVFDKPEIIRKCLNAIAEQTYKNIEVVVADDANNLPEEAGNNRVQVNEFRNYVNFPVRYITTYDGDYGLARARNEATVESTGDIMVYCDQRMILEPNAVEEFVKNLPADKCWLYGNKGGKKEFVENLSCIRREEVINFGLFNERMTGYGGLSQETRVRYRRQGGRTEYVESAKANATGKSSNRNRKRDEIINMKNRLWKMGLEQ
jgi:glycosyltransferase involved in cell wall biosynthesis